MFDIILKNSSVIDGSGNPWFKADIAVENGKIAAVGNLASEKAQCTVDVKSLTVTPGFIDPHSHTDQTVLKNNEALSSIQQGITTEFVGNCGFSMFPVTDRNKKFLIQQIADLFATDMEKAVLDWADFDGFKLKIEQKRIGTNLACFVGHGTIRMAVMGTEEENGDRATPTGEEMTCMKQFVDDLMVQGVWGLTTGLHYPPGRNATTEEIIELARVVAKHHGTYMSHIRGYTTLGGMEELLNIAEKTPIRSVISHNSGRWQTERKKLDGPSAEEKLLMFNKARARGVEVYMDVLPWGGSGSFSMSTILLWEDLESKFDEYGKRRDFGWLMDALKNPEKRKELENRARHKQQKFIKKIEEATKTRVRFGDVCIVNRSIRFPEYIGRSMAEIADMRGTDIVTAAADLLLEDEGNTFWGGWFCEGDIKRLLMHPAAMPSTDGFAQERNPPLVHLGDPPAVRNFASFPKVLGVYVREDHLFSLEEAVRKMTSLPAKAIGLTDRGLIRPGMWADINVFDPDRIAHMATYFEPRQYCIGIEYVLVNGEFAMIEGKPTGSLAGKVLIHNRDGLQVQ